MSHPSPEPSGSDISEFAAWEAEHPSQAREEGERERSLADMRRPERRMIWGDRDSSNDARSSDDEQVVEEKSAKEEVVEIPSSEVESEGESEEEQEQDEDDAPPSSQPRVEGAKEDKVEDENAIADSSKDEIEIKVKDVIEISSDEEEEDDKTDNEEEAEAEDEFEGFDVTPEDKEFLNKLLDVAPREEVMEITGKTRRITSQSISDISPSAQAMRNVKAFAEDHPFRDQDEWTEVELQEFKDDVFGFAIAAGMSELHADLEVRKATGAWKSEMGLPLNNDRELELEKNGKEKTFESDKPNPSNGGYKKRKHDVLGESSKSARGSHQSPQSEDAISMDIRSDDRDSVREAKRQRKAEKKARRKAERKAKRRAKQNGLTPASEVEAPGSKNHPAEQEAPQLSKHKNIPEVPKPKLQSSQSCYAEEEKSTLLPNKSASDVSMSAKDEKRIGQELKKKRREKVERKKLKRKAKLGSKKSEYFAKSKPSGLPFSTTLKDGLEAPNDLKPQRNYGEDIKQLEAVTQLFAKTAETRHDIHPNKIKKMAEKAKQAVKNAPILVKDVTAKKKAQEASSESKTLPEVVEKKKKNRNHKRHRNKNLLPKEPSGENEDLGNASIQDEDRADDLPPKKNDHDSSRKSTLDGYTDKGQDAHLTAARASIVEHQKSNNQSGNQNVSQSAPDASDSNVRPSKRRDRGRKSKNKKEDVEIPDAGESILVEPAATGPDKLVKSIELNELSGKKKRKRSKSTRNEEDAGSGEVDEETAIQPLNELPDTNSKKPKEGRGSHGPKRAVSVDTTELDNHPSEQSSKVHHSQ